MKNHWYHTGPLCSPFQHSSTQSTHPPSPFPAWQLLCWPSTPPYLPWTSLHQERASLWDWIGFNLDGLVSPVKRTNAASNTRERSYLIKDYSPYLESLWAPGFTQGVLSPQPHLPGFDPLMSLRMCCRFLQEQGFSS